MRRPGLRPPLLAATLAVALAGCSLVERPPIEPVFGAPYDILLGVPSSSASADATPLVSTTGQLVVVVQYLGGCSDHRFELDRAFDDTVARVWLVHNDPGDPCSEVQREELVFPLSEAVLARPRLVLLSPSGGELELSTADVAG